MPRCQETRVLRQKPRVNYYEPEEPSLDEYVFCESCADYVFEYCAIHGPLLVIPDDKVSYKPNIPAIVPRAALTIPRVFLHLARSIIPGAGIGVFSTLTLPRGVRFGPYRGLRSETADSMYCWQIYDHNNKRSHFVDAADPLRSNWMRYVNCARHWSEQNLVAYQYKGQLYYRTIKVIPRFTELLVFYGSEFANLLRVDLGAYNAPKGYAAKFGVPVAKKAKLLVVKETQSNISNKPNTEVKYNQNEMVVDKIQTVENAEETTKNNDNPIPSIRKSFIATKTVGITGNIQNDETPFKCDICGKCFKSKRELIIHICIHTRQNLHRSDICNKCYNNKFNLERHIHVHTSENLYKCDICDKRFRQNGDFVNHTCIRIGEKPYKCDICEKCFSTKQRLVLHIRIHTGEKPYKCDICEKCFSQNRYLVEHTRIHTGVKPYKCDICEKCFSQNRYLVKHTRIHTGEKPYKCDICEKCFSTKQRLVLHIRIHTGEKPYKCDICEKCFSQNRYLVEHTRIHTGVKPYKCDICEKCFSTKQYLVLHTRIHTGEKPYKCDICEKCFSQNSSLVLHIRTHTGEKPYKCDICEKCFSQNSSLVLHIRTHTGEKLYKHVRNVRLINVI